MSLTESCLVAAGARHKRLEFNAIPVDAESLHVAIQ